eukprot:CAMPEP_0184674028 /NCGR_PEP_ID=MMETSP0308-20130426/87008_1 /TAXON_ID=38269 /ORGANISM="Gloeochaete witrockiana, Strain SAG 46.84" /LENGTH=73 /DNA_ID=CAMNT_0027121589 /DNA_START=2336 /DNA_END=2554 /DNA_ORIENTATION=-
MLEDAKQKGKPLYIIFQDVKRAYDSLSWESLKAAFVRIKLSPEYIKFHEICFKKRRTQIDTAYGPTEEFELEA